MRAASGVVVVLLWMGHAAAATGLNLLLSPRSYTGHVYVQPPQGGADYVVFAGEKWPLQVVIANWSDEERVLSYPSGAPSVPWLLRSTMGATVVSMPVEIVRRRYAVGTGDQDVSHEAPPLRIGPRGYVRWEIVVDTGQLQPGQYRLDVSTFGTDDTGRPVFRQSPRIMFEVRAARGAEAEVLRRAAVRALDADAIPEARASIAALLGVHPGSYAAYELLADVAMSEGRQDEAAEMAQRAADQLTGRRDQLFLQWTDQRRVQAAVDALSKRARGRH